MVSEVLCALNPRSSVGNSPKDTTGLAKCRRKDGRSRSSRHSMDPGSRPGSWGTPDAVCCHVLVLENAFQPRCMQRDRTFCEDMTLRHGARLSMAGMHWCDSLQHGAMHSQSGLSAPSDADVLWMARHLQLLHLGEKALHKCQLGDIEHDIPHPRPPLTHCLKSHHRSYHGSGCRPRGCTASLAAFNAAVRASTRGVKPPK